MRIAVINTSKSRVQRHFEYHVYTIKTFVEDRSGGKYKVDIIDTITSDDVETSAKLIDNKKYDIILFRLLYWNVDFVYELIDKMTIKTSVIGVWGHDSFMYPEDYLKANVKFIIQDEPEISLYEFSAMIEEKSLPAKVPGIIYRDDVNKTLIYGTNRVLDSIDLIPSPYIEGHIDLNEETSVFWEVSRGCLFRCDFCVEFSHLNKVRFHSFGYLENELKLFKEKGIHEIEIGSPVFNLSHQHFKKILGMVCDYLPDCKLTMNVRPDILSKEEIDMLSEMNVYLNFGINTLNRKVLENIMTSINIESTLTNIRYINNYPGLPFGIDIIAGLPKVTYQEFLSDLDSFFEFWPINLNVYRLSLFPGTRVYNRIRELEYNVEASYPYRVVETPGFSKREIEKADELSEGINTLYNQGRLVSIFVIIVKALSVPAHEVIEKWNKWRRKHNVVVDECTEYMDLFVKIEEFFVYMFDRYQKRKLWPLACDLLYHNAYFTNAFISNTEDVVTYPYQLDAANDNSLIGINESVFIRRFNYDMEDVLSIAYIDIKDYSQDVDKENLYGVVYRLEGGVFIRTISDFEGDLFLFIKEQGEISVSELKKKFGSEEIDELVYEWCEEGVLYLK